MKRIITTLAFIGAGLSAFAQNSSLREGMREMLRESWKEKWRPAGRIVDHDQHLKTTATTSSEARVTTNGASVQEGEVSFAFHPKDSSKLVISFMEESSTGLNFPIYYSSNGGQTWNRSSFNSVSILAQDHAGQLIGGGGDPVFAWDKNGRVYFSWIYLSVKPALDTAYWSLMYAYSDNNGQTWTVPPGKDRYIGTGVLDAVTQDVINIGDGVTDRQWFAVDNTNGPNQGKLYCSFLQFPADNDPAKFGEAVKVKAYNATAFGPAKVAYNGQTQFGNVEVAPNGTLHLSFVDLGSFPQQVLHASSTDGGNSFSSEHVVSGGSKLFGQNTPHMVHDRENAALNMAVDGSGTLHLVWSDFAANSWQSFYSRSTDGGTSWSTPTNLNNTIASRKAFMPTVAAFGNNVSISMAAIDNKDSSGYYQIRSTDNGQTWSAPQLLSTGQGEYKSYNNGEFFGDYNRSQRSACVTYAAWSDGRGGAGPKMYFTKTDVCATPNAVGEITTINSNLQLEGLYPNPASTQLALSINAAKGGKFTAYMTDMMGRNVWNVQRSYNQGKGIISLPLTGLAAGNYLFTIQDSDGGLITRNLMIR
jgi:hypothetical protein